MKKTIFFSLEAQQVLRAIVKSLRDHTTSFHRHKITLCQLEVREKEIQEAYLLRPSASWLPVLSLTRYKSAKSERLVNRYRFNDSRRILLFFFEIFSFFHGAFSPLRHSLYIQACTTYADTIKAYSYRIFVSSYLATSLESRPRSLSLSLFLSSLPLLSLSKITACNAGFEVNSHSSRRSSYAFESTFDNVLGKRKMPRSRE